MSTKNKQNILEAITECNILRLKTDEALEFIQKQTKIKISERTFRRYKKELRDKLDDRLEHMIRTEIITETIQTIDLFKKIEREHWINYHAAESIKDKNSILDNIRKAQHDLIGSYDNTKIINQIENWFDSKLKEIEDKKKQANNNSEILTTYAN